MNDIELYKKLTSIAHEKRWSQKELAQNIGVSPVHFNRILAKCAPLSTWMRDKFEWFIEKHTGDKK